VPARHVIASVLLLVTAVYWATWVLVDPEPWTASTGAVIGTGLVGTVVIALAGILLEHSRLAYKVAWGTLGLVAVLALSHPLGLVWLLGVGIAGATALAMTSRNLDGWIRSEPPVAPIPNSAIGLAGLLLWTPVTTALASIYTDADLLPLLSLGSWAILIYYVRRLPGAMAVIRFGVPLLLISGWALLDPARIVWVAMLAVGGAFAWSSQTRLAVRPLIERGSQVLVPPELLDPDLRRALGIDRADQ
jgi:hypothetical protein